MHVGQCTVAVVRASAFRIWSRSACTSAICLSRLLINGRLFLETDTFRFGFGAMSGLVRICANSGILIQDNELVIPIFTA